MKAFTLLTAVTVLSLASCSKNDKPVNTTPPDYAETHHKLIQNHEKDSMYADSMKTTTAMPPQQVPDNKQK